MTFLGPYTGFILASYVAVGLVLAGLILWIIWDGRRQRQLLAELEREAGGRKTNPSRKSEQS